MIVTVVAYKRPELLAQCLESVAKADLSKVSDIVISLDYYSAAMNEEMIKVFNKHRIDFLPVSVCHVLGERFGVANHPRLIYNLIAATRKYAWTICALEEDTIVSPDAFLYAAWALRQPGYKFVNLFAKLHPLIGGAMEDMVGGRDRIHEDNELRGGFGWAFTRSFWSELEPQWNGKIRLPYGWDWQLTYLCYRNNWRCLTPEVSRVYNTGREDGTYGTHETWDAELKDVVICQQAPDKYVVVKHNLDLVTMPDWVVEEMRL